MNQTPSPVVTTAPLPLCRHCGGAMDRYYQPGLLPGREATPFITCWRADCKLYGFTLSERSYSTLDLTDYGHVTESLGHLDSAPVT